MNDNHDQVKNKTVDAFCSKKSDMRKIVVQKKTGVKKMGRKKRKWGLNARDMITEKYIES